MRRIHVTIALFSFFLAFFCLSRSLSAEKKDRFRQERQRMVDRQILSRGVSDDRVLGAMRRVPRHRFVPKKVESQAYSDHPLPIAEGQTISQPYVVAWMTEVLKLKSGDRVLEVGTGSGYQAAILAEVVEEVYSIEIRPNLVESARKNLEENGYTNVKTKGGDGYDGWEEHAPFDAIIITCAANHVPPPLLKQLKDGGRLILPLGSTTYFQNLTLITKKGEDMQARQLGGVTFVPMVGKMDR